MIARKAGAIWEGKLMDGRGSVKLGSGAFSGPYSFGSRFQDQAGTNPEELIGAAHAGCFSMAFSKVLEDAGFNPKKIETEAVVALEKLAEGFAITAINLKTRAEIPGIDKRKFLELAEIAKSNCPVSRALKGVRIGLEAILS